MLVNGSGGIAVGMATNIPPHNLGEVIDATCACIDNPDITTEQLMKYVQGPDFPTGGEIIGYSGIRQAYQTGRGKLFFVLKQKLKQKKNIKKLLLPKFLIKLIRNCLLDRLENWQEIKKLMVLWKRMMNQIIPECVLS